METLEDWSWSRMSNVMSDVCVAEHGGLFVGCMTQPTLNDTVGGEKRVFRVFNQLNSLHILFKT